VGEPHVALALLERARRRPDAVKGQVEHAGYRSVWPLIVPMLGATAGRAYGTEDETSRPS
jgi:hypothetical protein